MRWRRRAAQNARPHNLLQGSIPTSEQRARRTGARCSIPPAAYPRIAHVTRQNAEFEAIAGAAYRKT